MIGSAVIERRCPGRVDAVLVLVGQGGQERVGLPPLGRAAVEGARGVVRAMVGWASNHGGYDAGFRSRLSAGVSSRHHANLAQLDAAIQQPRVEKRTSPGTPRAARRAAGRRSESGGGRDCSKVS